MRAALLGALWFAGSACQGPVSPCAAETSVLGTWLYAGMQDAPVPAELTGTLQVTSESCHGFQGRLDVLEADGLGPARRLAGPVSGRVLNASSVRFDAFLTAVPRQHVASLRAEKVEGSWVLVRGPSEPPFTGRFDAQREPTR